MTRLLGNKKEAAPQPDHTYFTRLPTRRMSDSLTAGAPRIDVTLT